MSMRTVALALACFAFSSNARRVQKTSDAADEPNSMNKFASLLLASGNAGAAYQAASAGHRPAGQKRASSVSMSGTPTATPAFQDDSRWGELIKIDEDFQFEEARIPDLTPTAQILTNIQERGLLTKISELGLLSQAESAGVFSQLESQGAFSLAETYLPLVDDFEVLELAQAIVDEEVPLAPAATALLTLLPVWGAAVALGAIDGPIPTVITGLVAVLAAAAGAAGLAVNGLVDQIRD